MDGSQADPDSQDANRKVNTGGQEDHGRMARDDELVREREVVDLQAGADDFFIEQERRLREDGCY